MTREAVIAFCNKTHDVGSVEHADYADYVVGLQSRRKLNDELHAVELAYMSVDGKLARANQDHRDQSKRLDFADPVVLVDNQEQITLLIIGTSVIYGARHGIATSRKKSGTNAER